MSTPTDTELDPTPPAAASRARLSSATTRWWVASLAVGLVAIGAIWPLTQERICVLDAWYPNGCGGQMLPQQWVAIAAIAVVVVLCAASTVVRFTVDRARWAIIGCLGAIVVCVTIAAIYSTVQDGIQSYPPPTVF